MVQGVFQSELRNRLRHPGLRTLWPASWDGRADMLNFFPAWRVVKPLPVMVRFGTGPGKTGSLAQRSRNPARIHHRGTEVTEYGRR